MNNKQIIEWLDSQGIDYDVKEKTSELPEMIEGNLYNFVKWSSFAIENVAFVGAFERGKMYVGKDNSKAVDKAFESFKKEMLANIKRYRHLGVN